MQDVNFLIYVFYLRQDTLVSDQQGLQQFPLSVSLGNLEYNGIWIII